VEAELKKLDDKKGLNIEVFRTFCRTHRNLLFPAFKLQRQLQSAVLGEAFWETASNRRVQMSKGKYMKMADLMEIVSQTHIHTLHMHRLHTLGHILHRSIILMLC
jgi:hypothetical protein